MKKLGVLLAFVLCTTAVISRDGKGGQPHLGAVQAACAAGAGEGAGQPHVAEVRVLATDGDDETIEIRISGKNANAFESMAFEIEGMRAVAPQMTKTSGSDDDGHGNSDNGTSLWTVDIDLDRYADANGDVAVLLRPCCTIRPFIALVVRSKGR